MREAKAPPMYAFPVFEMGLCSGFLSVFSQAALGPIFKLQDIPPIWTLFNSHCLMVISKTEKNKPLRIKFRKYKNINLLPVNN